MDFTTTGGNPEEDDGVGDMFGDLFGSTGTTASPGRIMGPAFSIERRMGPVAIS